ncbi:MAG: bifunctional demethylmenaquinone methyltransferase/2-methoxy-6-polyprenyl-1,4-benzoquinol methylase UbiE [Alphaproteobacteria bacterium]|nr:bifunctional demethylmenaquinone methyltransferase/2-methoxy-6-polyprenyl-1,4-benzoquinol methylase UbiE [Alphaproteobacteria bacterium]
MKVPFGFQDVDPEDKPHLVRNVFDQVASRYDIMNDFMSAGIHRLWKRSFVAEIPKRPNLHLLDVAGGTGDIAFRYLSSLSEINPETRVTLCDINQAMLSVGQRRALTRQLPLLPKWICADALQLPIPSRSIDVYTIAFGLRNVTDIHQALFEAYRVLKPGGLFLCLEFSQISYPLLEQLYTKYAFHIIPLMGQLVAKGRTAYQYLVESIARFPNQETLVQMLASAGFKHTTYRNLSGGTAAIHKGWRV